VAGGAADLVEEADRGGTKLPIRLPICLRHIKAKVSMQLTERKLHGIVSAVFVETLDYLLCFTKPARAFAALSGVGYIATPLSMS